MILGTVLALMLLAFLLLPRHSSEQVVCNPSGAPVGSMGCQPAFASALATDLILLWRSSAWPNANGTVPLSALSPMLGANMPTSCAGAASGTLRKNGVTVEVCP